MQEKKEIIPFRHFNHCVGRKAQAKTFGVVKGRWPVKSCEFILQLLRNAESNADYKGLDTDVGHIGMLWTAMQVVNDAQSGFLVKSLLVQPPST
ncbi:unnamed protein product, partial [Mesorhabditis spiculigera]